MNKTIDTKNKIKDASIKLFNSKDTLTITTNHIAKEAGISPGNLYYHYKNKEEIILDIYKELSFKFIELNSFEKMMLSSNFFKTMDEMFNEYSKLFFEYKFLLRDSTVLMALYPKIKELLIINQKKRIRQIEGILNFLIRENILEKINKASLDKRAKMHWFITDYWQIFASSTGDITLESIQEAKEIYFEFMIYPFLSEKGKKMLREIS